MSPRHSFVFASALAGTLGVAPAQGTTAELTAEVRVGAQASNNFRSQGLAPGPITTPRSASAIATCCLGMGGAAITMTVGPLATGARWATDSSALGGSAYSYCTTPPCGELVVRAPGQTVGSVIITALAGTVSQGSFWVDVSSDGTREINMPFTNLRREFRVCGTSDIVVRASVSANLVTSFSAELFELRVEIVPGLAPVATTAYGTPCGAALAVTDQPAGAVHDLAFAVSGGFPNGLAALLIGVGRAQIPIQGCDIHTVPLVVLTMGNNAQGNATFHVPVHGVISGLTFHAQGLSFDAALQMRATRGAEVSFRDC